MDQYKIILFPGGEDMTQEAAETPSPAVIGHCLPLQKSVFDICSLSLWDLSKVPKQYLFELYKL